MNKQKKLFESIQVDSKFYETARVPIKSEDPNFSKMNERKTFNAAYKELKYALDNGDFTDKEISTLKSALSILAKK